MTRIEKPIYKMTFEEVCRRGEAGETLVTNLGYMICSRDRHFKKHVAHELWAEDVAAAKEKGLMDRPKNRKGKLFSWSYSSLNAFEGCPRKYAAEKFYCTIPWQDSEAIRYGNEVHLAAEQALKGEKVTNIEMLKPVQKYVDLLLSQQDQGATLTAEMELTLDENLNPVSWFSKEAWFRAKLDVVVERNEQAFYYDWKTGKKVKDDQDQLKMCCAALSILKPEIETFTPKLIWTKHSAVTGTSPQTLSREDLQTFWASVLGRVKRLEDAWRSEIWVERPSGLCRNYCPVTECPHCGKGGRRR